MSRVPRFFIPDLPAEGEIPLPPEQERHARRVLRLAPGDAVELFDGRGHNARAVVAGTGDALRVRIVPGASGPPDEGSRAGGLRIGLAFAIPKPKPCSLLLQKCCEAGVDELFPVLSERSLFPRAAPAGLQARWEKILQEAAKQSGRDTLPVLHPPAPTAQIPGRLKEFGTLFLASLEPDAAPFPAVLDGIDGNARNIHWASAAAVLIGPEGGWTSAEERLLRDAGALPVRLSRNVLRAETAALAAVSTLAMRDLCR